MSFINRRFIPSRPDRDYEYSKAFPVEIVKGRCSMPMSIELPYSVEQLAPKMQIVDSSYGFITDQRWTMCCHGNVHTYIHDCPFKGSTCTGSTLFGQRKFGEARGVLEATTSVLGLNKCDCEDARLDEPPYKFESVILKKYESPFIACCAMASFFCTTAMMFPEAIMVENDNLGIGGKQERLDHFELEAVPGIHSMKCTHVCEKPDLKLEESVWYIAYNEGEELDRFELKLTKASDGGFYFAHDLMDWCVKDKEIICAKCNHSNKKASGVPKDVGKGCRLMFGIGCGVHYLCEECIYPFFGTRGTSGSDYAWAVVENKQPLYCPSCRCRLDCKGISITLTTEKDGGVVQRMLMPAPIPKLFIGMQGVHSDTFANAVVPFVERSPGIWYSFLRITERARNFVDELQKTCRTELNHLEGIEAGGAYDGDYCESWMDQRKKILTTDLCSLDFDEIVLTEIMELLNDRRKYFPFLDCNKFIFTHEFLFLDVAYFEQKMSRIALVSKFLRLKHPGLFSWIRDELANAGQSI